MRASYMRPWVYNLFHGLAYTEAVIKTLIATIPGTIIPLAIGFFPIILPSLIIPGLQWLPFAIAGVVGIFVFVKEFPANRKDALIRMGFWAQKFDAHLQNEEFDIDKAERIFTSSHKIMCAVESEITEIREILASNPQLSEKEYNLLTSRLNRLRQDPDKLPDFQNTETTNAILLNLKEATEETQRLANSLENKPKLIAADTHRQIVTALANTKKVLEKDIKETKPDKRLKDLSTLKKCYDKIVYLNTTVKSFLNDTLKEVGNHNTFALLQLKVKQFFSFSLTKKIDMASVKLKKSKASLAVLDTFIDHPYKDIASVHNELFYERYRQRYINLQGGYNAMDQRISAATNDISLLDEKINNGKGSNILQQITVPTNVQQQVREPSPVQQQAIVHELNAEQTQEKSSGNMNITINLQMNFSLPEEQFNEKNIDKLRVLAEEKFMKTGIAIKESIPKTLQFLGSKIERNAENSSVEKFSISI